MQRKEQTLCKFQCPAAFVHLILLDGAALQMVYASGGIDLFALRLA